MIRVFIVDDHSIVREGLKQILRDVPEIEVVGEASSASEFLVNLPRRNWDVVVLDISLPDRSGLEILKEVKKEAPRLPVLVLTMHAEDQYAMRVFKAGASGYLTKESAPSQLIAAIKKLHSGGKFLSDHFAEKLVVGLDLGNELPLHRKLSDREFEVLRLMGDGKSIGDIATRLSLSVKTISTYRSRILEKLQLQTNADIIHYAIENEISDLPARA